jgi:hypothetical protein
MSAELRWRCPCGRVNLGENPCATCNRERCEPPTGIERIIASIPKHPPASADVEDRYPDAHEYKDFGASDRFVTLLTAVTDRARYCEWLLHRPEGEHSPEHRVQSINALGNAEGDLLTAIAELEQSAAPAPLARKDGES